MTEFPDGLRLAPGCEYLWPLAMRTALSACESGTIEYGWFWSLETPREDQLRAIDGVEITDVVGIDVRLVEFARWPDWKSYYRAISENCRRNAKKARQRHGGIGSDLRTGPSALSILPRLAWMRYTLSKQKHFPFSLSRVLAGYIGGVLLFRNDNIYAIAKAGKKLLAVMHLGRFGSVQYYFDGAAAPEADGAAWFLMLDVLEKAYAAEPQGKFLVGYQIQGTEDDPGLTRAQDALRVTHQPTSVITFRWAGAT